MLLGLPVRGSGLDPCDRVSLTSFSEMMEQGEYDAKLVDPVELVGRWDP